MNPILIGLCASSAFFLCHYLSTTDRLALTRTVFAGLLMTVIACLSIPTPGGEINEWDKPITAQAQYEDGRVAETIIQRAPKEAIQRMTFVDRSLILEKTLPTLTIGLWSILVLTLLGLIFTGLAPQMAQGPRFLTLSGLYGILSACLILWWAHDLPSSEYGEAGIRNYLSTFSETDNVVSFTVPEKGWEYVILGGFPITAVYMILAVSIAAVVRRYLGSMDLGAIQPLWVIGLLFCVVYRVHTVGGLPWRAADGALLLTALIVVAAQYYTREKAASLPMAAVALFPLLLAYTV